MKTRSFVLTLVLAASFSSIFAADITKSVLSSFQNDFSKAENIQWTVTGPLSRVSFTLDGKTMFAYYGENGDRCALGNYVALSEIPAKLMSSLKASYKGYWITDAFVLTQNDETSYYVTVENADRKVIVKSSGAETWSKFKTVTKE